MNLKKMGLGTVGSQKLIYFKIEKRSLSKRNIDVSNFLSNRLTTAATMYVFTCSLLLTLDDLYLLLHIY